MHTDIIRALNKFHLFLMKKEMKGNIEKEKKNFSFLIFKSKILLQVKTMNTMKIEKFLTKALDYATSIYKLHEKLNLLISKNIQEKNEWQKNIEYIHLVEEMEKKLYDSILPVSLIWIKTAKEKLLEMHLEKKSKNVLNFYIEGDNFQEQIMRRVESKLNKLPYDNILFGLEITDPSNYIFNDWLSMYWKRMKKNFKNPTVQAMLFRLAYLDEAFESLCIRNGFSMETNYLPILNKEQEEKYPEDYQYYKEETGIALALDEFEWLSDKRKFDLPISLEDNLREEWIRMVYENISAEAQEELIEMLEEINEELCQKLKLTKKNLFH